MMTQALTLAKKPHVVIGKLYYYLDSVSHFIVMDFFCIEKLTYVYGFCANYMPLKVVAERLTLTAKIKLNFSSSKRILTRIEITAPLKPFEHFKPALFF